MNMVNVRIKQLEERSSTAGFFFGDAATGKFRRKLEPGEVVAVDADDTIVKQAMSSGKLELTLDTATRPLDFDTDKEARFTSPRFRPRDENEAAEAERVREAVAVKLNGSADSEDDTVAEVPARTPADAAAEMSDSNPRVNRRRGG